MKDKLVQFTDKAAFRVKMLLKNDIKNNKSNLRVYIIGGGCSGFQYKFILDKNINKDDLKVKKKGAVLVVDPLSLQYLIGGVVDYIENIEGSKFIVINPNAETTCSCGSSFSI